MQRNHKLIATVVAVVAVGGGGAAIAATALDSPSARSAAIVTDAAQQLGVQPNALSDALKKAEEKQLDADVTAGRITQAQADTMKAAIESGQAPLVGGGGGGLRGPGGPGGPGGELGHDGFGGPGGRGGFGENLTAAATYLGVTTAEIQTALQSGKTLADVAKAQGKTADGLVSALVDSAKTRLDSAVTAGNLTAAQETQIVAGLKANLTDMVNGKRPTGGLGMRGGFGGHHDDGGGLGGGFGGDDDGGGLGGGSGSGSGGSGSFGGAAGANA